MVRRLLALLLTLLLTGCAAQSTPPELSFAPGEGERLVLYTSHKEEVYWPIVKEFEERTGIWVEVVTGGTNELLEKIQSQSDTPLADVMFGGGVESLTSYADCFTPYRCAGAEAIAPAFQAPGDLWTPFSALPVVLIYNTKLVGAGALTCWDDLLSPRYHGRIAFADPAVSGSSFTALVTALHAVEGTDEEVLRRFAESLGGRQLQGSGDVVASVAGGTDLVGITLEETALKGVAAGYDIALVYPSDGTSCVPDASALIRGAPHADNAKLFLDFTVSAETQRLLTGTFCRRSVREDVPAAETMPPLDQLPAAEYDVAWASEHRDGVLMTWAFYLGGEEAA